MVSSMRKCPYIVLGFLFMTIAQAAKGSVLESPCPSDIRLPAAVLPAGSELLSSTLPEFHLSLVSVEYSDGHPEEKAFLAPSSQSRDLGWSVVFHVFGSGREPWISCSYSDGAKHIKFTRKLGSPQQCVGKSAQGKAPVIACS